MNKKHIISGNHGPAGALYKEPLFNLHQFIRQFDVINTNLVKIFFKFYSGFPKVVARKGLKNA